MAWQRKLPFGYQMRQGIIKSNASEAAVVKEIFARYLRGESLLHIAEELTLQGICYHEHIEKWNKNMVKRIIENRHYLGDERYPRMVSDADFISAQMLKTGKNTYAPCAVSTEIRKKTVCGHCGAKLVRVDKNRRTARWECENLSCRHAVLISDERLVVIIDALLNELSQTPESLAKRIQQKPEMNSNAQRIANELTNALNRSAESAEYLRTLVFACAAERYRELPDCSLQYQVDKLCERVETEESDESIRKRLLDTVVQAIRVTDADGITLELVNGQLITKEGVWT